MNRKMLAFLATLVSVCPASAGDAEVLNTVRLAHATTVQALHTVACKLSVACTPKIGWGDEQSEYWREGDAFRCRAWMGSGQVSDLYFRDGVYRVLNRFPTGSGATSGKVTTADMAVVGNPWTYGLFSFLGRDKYRVPLDELLGQPHTLNGVKPWTRAGTSGTVIDVTHDRGRLEVWLAHDRNWLVCRLNVWDTMNPGHVAASESVSEFTQVTPGVYFPARVESEVFDPRTVQSRLKRKAVFTDIRVNQPLPPDAMRFQFPGASTSRT